MGHAGSLGNRIAKRNDCLRAAGRQAGDVHGRFRAVGRVGFVERRRLIRPAVLQSAFLASQRPVEAAADDRGRQAGLPAELGVQLVEDLGDQPPAMRVVAVAPPGCPERAGIVDGQIGASCAKRARIRGLGWCL